ncbi:hypothetical protein T459_11881 [Capsicum annuum]|uniref:ABC transporter domain-containing protein n=1 Tax=Capsicum annuum TaxID=4072 RepID=A0A2G2ZN71_CAPAN|nr:hypothetical protein T459_11881 [Capsicum annuum]
MFTAPGGDAFIKSTRDNDEEQELIWDAIERLPTYDRLRKGILRQTLDDGKINYHEGFLEKIKIVPSKKRIVNILRHVNGIVRPSRMTLLLGPPGFGKTTLLKTFVGVLDKDPRVNGRISYCGRELSDFTPQKTCAYISQHDIHHGEMITFRETLDFAGRCLAVGKRNEDDDLAPDRATAEVIDTTALNLSKHVFPPVLEFASLSSQSPNGKF